MLRTVCVVLLTLMLLLNSSCDHIEPITSPEVVSEKPYDVVYSQSPSPEVVYRETYEIYSPNEAYRVEFVGFEGFRGVPNEENPVESIIVIDTSNEEIILDMYGYSRRTVLWSSDSRYLAITGVGKMRGVVTLLECQTRESIEIPLPDGTYTMDTGEYTFLQAIEWKSNNELLLEHMQNRPRGEEGYDIESIMYTIDQSADSLSGISVYIN